ncbi:MAG: T9SS type A sorting domain-containing protein [Bacteroidia bacterium]|nr:T9SS type A sorting domain-containing protein [Bacteroidia bacterium]
MRLIISIIFFSVTQYSLAQVQFFEKKFGTALQDIARSVVQLPSGSIFMLGHSASGNIGNTDISLVKLDKYGMELGTEYYGDNNLNFGYSISKCIDGNFIIVGDAVISPIDSDVLIYKIDTLGNVLWNHTFSTPFIESCKYITQTLDGGFISVGLQSDSVGSNNSFVLKLDANGAYQWHKSIGGNSNDYASMIVQLPSGNYILTADTDSHGAGAIDIELTKLDINGNIIWQQTYGDALNNGCQGLYLTSDFYLMSYGETEIFPASPFDMYLEKIDTNGISVWKKYYGNPTTTDACFSIVETSTGGFMLTGYSNSMNNGQPIDLAIVQTDAFGNQIWARAYGDTGVDIGFQIIKSINGGFIIVGKYYNVTNSDDDYYLLHVDELFGGLSSIVENEKEEFTLFPNPSTNKFYLHFQKNEKIEYISIYSLTGQQLFFLNHNDYSSFIELNTNLSEGFYLLEIKIENQLFRKKIAIN